jgi:YggT family protein
VLTSIVDLIVGTIAGLLGFLFLLRFWTQAVRVRPPSTLSDFLFKFTDWLVRPLRRLLPGVGGYDWASLIAAFLMALASVALLVLVGGRGFGPYILLLALHKLVTWILYGLMGILIIEVILSWVNPQAPMAPFIRALNQPVLRPFRRILPPISGIDLSPLLAFLVLQILLYLSAGILTLA